MPGRGKAGPWWRCPAGAAQAPLALADLNTEFNDEPRIHDLLLAEKLGFKQAYDIRQLITRHEAELRSYGAIYKQITRAATDGEGFRHGTENPPKRRGGRPGVEYFLTEGQALVLCAVSRTAEAARMRGEIIGVFLAYRRGTLAPAAAPVPADGVAELARAVLETVAMVRELAGDVRELRQAVLDGPPAGGRLPSTPREAERSRSNGYLSLGRPRRGETPEAYQARAAAWRAELAMQDRRRAAKAARDAEIRRVLTTPAGDMPPRGIHPVPAIAAPEPLTTTPGTPPLLMGAKAIAQFAGIRPRQVYYLADTGRLPSFRMGRTLCSTPADVERAIRDARASGGLP